MLNFRRSATGSLRIFYKQETGRTFPIFDALKLDSNWKVFISNASTLWVLGEVCN
jgi:hypothetical protein